MNVNIYISNSELDLNKQNVELVTPKGELCILIVGLGKPTVEL